MFEFNVAQFMALHDDAHEVELEESVFWEA